MAALSNYKIRKSHLQKADLGCPFMKHPKVVLMCPEAPLLLPLLPGRLLGPPGWGRISPYAHIHHLQKPTPPADSFRSEVDKEPGPIIRPLGRVKGFQKLGSPETKPSKGAMRGLGRH